ncbi:hypothetical protein [Reyranella sp. CPCC 100927]|uniref:COG3904 family protein n=1 Tax=Reyranella sp. CPCC 100927 TaxID=2599616 RepID=UPI0011B502C4|nr:hypothetical protein [Reyranella sp. CPCC 100927]TWT10036.1 hypothetical protein FQU96_18250 [Reyranella sp. CPCC 100927]
MDDRPHIHVPAWADVGLWRIGTAPLLDQAYARATWVLVAQLVALGAIWLSVTYHRDTSAIEVVIIALLVAAALAFSVMQAGLVWLAIARNRHWDTPSNRWLSAGLGVVMLVASGFVTYAKTVPSITELWNIAHGDAALRDGSMAVSDDGTQLFFARTFSLGTAEEFKRLLQSAPNVTTIHLQSPGGRLGEAVEIHDTIRARRLDTVVDDFCFSACTIAYLGGKERQLREDAKLGFHGSAFPGLAQSELDKTNRAMLRFLVAAGVDVAFARRAVSTPAESLWIPPATDLVDAGVVHKIIR